MGLIRVHEEQESGLVGDFILVCSGHMWLVRSPAAGLRGWPHPHVHVNLASLLTNQLVKDFFYDVGFIHQIETFRMNHAMLAFICRSLVMT